jgi:hypothetical protein
MDFMFVGNLVEYWNEYPPVHELVRAFVGFESKKQPWREQRAKEMGDETFVYQLQGTGSSARPARPSPSAEDVRMALQSVTGARHLDCAPGHIQEAVARSKRGEHMNIPPPQ